MRLRQLCCHPPFIQAILDPKDDENMIKADKEDNAECEDLTPMLFKQTRSALLQIDNPIFDKDRRSSKVLNSILIIFFLYLKL